MIKDIIYVTLTAISLVVVITSFIFEPMVLIKVIFLMILVGSLIWLSIDILSVSGYKFKNERDEE